MSGPRASVSLVRTARLTRCVMYVVIALSVGACSSPTQPPPVDDEFIDVEGLWLVEPGPGTFYGSGGTTTVEFGPQRSGTAEYLSRSTSNDVLTCERHVYAAVAEHVLLLDGIHYDAQANGVNQIELSTQDESITLTRVTGAPPVARCLETQVTEVQSFDFGPGSWTSMDAVGSTLYFNTNETGNPIVGYDVSTNVLGPQRTYAGGHDHIVAARTDNEFYGNCACGNITTLERFDLPSSTALVTASTQTDYGVFMTAEYGAFDGTSVLLGGRDFDNPGVNHVLTLNADTLALVSQRDVLPEAFLTEIAWTGTQLAALVNSSIVLIGNDGKADATIGLPENLIGFPVGLAVIGTSFYVLTQSSDGEAVIFEASMP